MSTAVSVHSGVVSGVISLPNDGSPLANVGRKCVEHMGHSMDDYQCPSYANAVLLARNRKWVKGKTRSYMFRRCLVSEGLYVYLPLVKLFEVGKKSRLEGEIKKLFEEFMKLFMEQVWSKLSLADQIRFNTLCPGIDNSDEMMFNMMVISLIDHYPGLKAVWDPILQSIKPKEKLLFKELALAAPEVLMLFMSNDKGIQKKLKSMKGMDGEGIQDVMEQVSFKKGMFPGDKLSGSTHSLDFSKIHYTKADLMKDIIKVLGLNEADMEESGPNNGGGGSSSSSSAGNRWGRTTTIGTTSSSGSVGNRGSQSTAIGTTITAKHGSGNMSDQAGGTIASGSSIQPVNSSSSSSSSNQGGQTAAIGAIAMVRSGSGNSSNQAGSSGIDGGSGNAGYNSNGRAGTCECTYDPTLDRSLRCSHCGRVRHLALGSDEGTIASSSIIQSVRSISISGNVNRGGQTTAIETTIAGKNGSGNNTNQVGTIASGSIIQSVGGGSSSSHGNVNRGGQNTTIETDGKNSSGNVYSDQVGIIAPGAIIQTVSGGIDSSSDSSSSSSSSNQVDQTTVMGKNGRGKINCDEAGKIARGPTIRAARRGGNDSSSSSSSSSNNSDQTGIIATGHIIESVSSSSSSSSQGDQTTVMSSSSSSSGNRRSQTTTVGKAITGKNGRGNSIEQAVKIHESPNQRTQTPSIMISNSSSNIKQRNNITAAKDISTIKGKKNGVKAPPQSIIPYPIIDDEDRIYSTAAASLMQEMNLTRGRSTRGNKSAAKNPSTAVRSKRKTADPSSDTAAMNDDLYDGNDEAQVDDDNPLPDLSFNAEQDNLRDANRRIIKKLMASDEKIDTELIPGLLTSDYKYGRADAAGEEPHWPAKILKTAYCDECCMNSDPSTNRSVQVCANCGLLYHQYCHAENAKKLKVTIRPGPPVCIKCLVYPFWCIVNVIPVDPTTFYVWPIDEPTCAELYPDKQTQRDQILKSDQIDDESEPEDEYVPQFLEKSRPSVINQLSQLVVPGPDYEGKSSTSTSNSNDIVLPIQIYLKKNCSLTQQKVVYTAVLFHVDEGKIMDNTEFSQVGRAEYSKQLRSELKATYSGLWAEHHKDKRYVHEKFIEDEKSNRPVRQCAFHRITDVSPSFLPHCSLKNKYYSSFNASAAAVGHGPTEDGYLLWKFKHGDQEITVADVLNKYNVISDPAFRASPYGQENDSGYRDQLATLCTSECQMDRCGEREIQNGESVSVRCKHGKIHHTGQGTEELPLLRCVWYRVDPVYRDQPFTRNSRVWTDCLNSILPKNMQLNYETDVKPYEFPQRPQVFVSEEYGNLYPETRQLNSAPFSEAQWVSTPSPISGRSILVAYTQVYAGVQVSGISDEKAALPEFAIVVFTKPVPGAQFECIPQTLIRVFHYQCFTDLPVIGPQLSAKFSKDRATFMLIREQAREHKAGVGPIAEGMKRAAALAKPGTEFYEKYRDPGWHARIHSQWYTMSMEFLFTPAYGAPVPYNHDPEVYEEFKSPVV